MKLDDLLNSDLADLPKSRPEKDIIKFYREVTAEYMKAVDSLIPSDHVAMGIRQKLPQMKFAAVRLRESLEASFVGKPDAHFRCVEEVLRIFQEEIEDLSSVPVTHENLPILYRMRKAEPGRVLSRPEMFHIPFQLRELVGTQRYSYPGLPCLYLGSSLYVCWEELRRPDLNYVHVTGMKLRPGQTIKVLDLSHRPKWLTMEAMGAALYNIEKVSRIRRAVAIIWPLLAACSMRPVPIYDEGITFRAEYMIPQSVLRWMLDRDEFDGLRYFSCRALDKSANRLVVNHVYPVKTLASSGYCSRLTSKFEMTQPVNWQYLLVAPPQSGVKPNNNTGSFAFGVAGGEPGSYFGTQFHQLELYIDSMEFGPVI